MGVDPHLRHQHSPTVVESLTGSKKQLENLGKWLKALAGKAAGALPGIIGATVSWLLKTVVSVAVWLAEHVWALAVALIAAVAVWLRNYRAR